MQAVRTVSRHTTQPPSCHDARSADTVPRKNLAAEADISGRLESRITSHVLAIKVWMGLPMLSHTLKVR
jgi:hypothetical protein